MELWSATDRWQSEPEDPGFDHSFERYRGRHGVRGTGRDHSRRKHDVLRCLQGNQSGRDRLGENRQRRRGCHRRHRLEHCGQASCINSGRRPGLNRGNALQIRVNVMAQGDITPPSPMFSPPNGRKTNDAGRTITLTFAEFVRKDSGGTALEDGDLGRDPNAGRRTTRTAPPIPFLDQHQWRQAGDHDRPDERPPRGQGLRCHQRRLLRHCGQPGVGGRRHLHRRHRRCRRSRSAACRRRSTRRTAFTATFTFSEEVTGFDTDDVTVSGGSKERVRRAAARATPWW